MRLTFLGTGTSVGVPQLGCGCEVCTSADPRDRRLRASVLVDAEDGSRLLIDCGPDFRTQMLRQEFRPLCGVLLTHEHYDHVGGLDDLRPFCIYGPVHIYADSDCCAHIREHMAYCLGEHRYPGSPRIELHSLPLYSADDFELRLGPFRVQPVTVEHGRLPILGYRIGQMAWITDMLTLPEESYSYLQGLDCLIMNALRFEKHWTHQSLSEALEKAKRIGARETYFIHMSHDIGLHSETSALLPDHIHLAYDGMEIML